MKFKRRKSKKTNPDHTGLDLEVLSLLWDSDETYSDNSKFILKHFSTDPVKATAVLNLLSRFEKLYYVDLSLRLTKEGREYLTQLKLHKEKTIRYRITTGMAIAAILISLASLIVSIISISQ